MEAGFVAFSSTHGRIVFRQIASSYVAHWAPREKSLADAIHVGSIRIGAIDRPDRLVAFVDLMRAVVADAIERADGVRPQWELENH